MKRTRSAQKRNKIKRLWIRTSPYQKRVARCGRVNDSECASGVRNVFSAPTPPAMVGSVLRSHRNPAEEPVIHSPATPQSPHAPSTMRESRADVLHSGWPVEPARCGFHERVCASTYASRAGRGNTTIPESNRAIFHGGAESRKSRITTGERKAHGDCSPRGSVYWFPFSWASVSTHTHTHGLHLQLHRPPWVCEAAGCDANGTG